MLIIGRLRYKPLKIYTRLRIIVSDLSNYCLETIFLLHDGDSAMIFLLSSLKCVNNLYSQLQHSTQGALSFYLKRAPHSLQQLDY